MLFRHQLEEETPGKRHHETTGDRERDDEREVPVVPRGRESCKQETTAVEEGRPEDHAGNAEAITQPTRE